MGQVTSWAPAKGTGGSATTLGLKHLSQCTCLSSHPPAPWLQMVSHHAIAVGLFPTWQLDKRDWLASLLGRKAKGAFSFPEADSCQTPETTHACL